MNHEGLLKTVGARVRRRREDIGLSRRDLSETCGVSERYLGELEAGRGNISLARFADVADALGTSPAALLADAEPAAAGTRAIALLGVRGAGKTTLGQRLATALGRPFIEVDREIESAAGLSLAEIFELHGEAYYRRLEREVLRRILHSGTPSVLATGGSIVTDPDTWALLRQRAVTVWLRARAEDHWDRVIQQGDARPMRANPHAYAELEALLAARVPLYADAHHTVDTSNKNLDQVSEQLVELTTGAFAQRPT